MHPLTAFTKSLTNWISPVKTPPEEELRTWNGKKKIMVITGSGGGGHLAAAEAIKKALEANYQVLVIKPFEGISGDDWFNYLQQKGQHKLLNVLTNMQIICELFFCPKQVLPKIESAIEDFSPDMVISVYPVANYLTLDLARKKNIPMLVIPTDIEARHFFHFIQNPGSGFQVGLPFEDPKLQEALSGYLQEDNFSVTGYPLRREFGYDRPQLQDTIEKIERQFKIKPGELVMGIMMGSQGVGDAVARNAQILSRGLKLPVKVHIVTFCVANQALIQATEKVQRENRNPSVEIHILRERVDGLYSSALVERSKTYLSKPGGGTLNEMIAKKRYTLYTKADGWEGGNLQYVETRKWGETLDEEHLVEQVTRVLMSPDTPMPDAPGCRFEERLRSVVEKSLSAKPVYHPEPSSVEKWKAYLSLDPAVKAQVKELMSSYMQSLGFGAPAPIAIEMTEAKNLPLKL